jgi:trans-AT polyketide synthase/acyltransferase/oxidoreductase domain-containing protein
LETSIRVADTPGTKGQGPESASALVALVERVSRPAWVFIADGKYVVLDAPPARRDGARVAYLPPIRLEDLGDPTFTADHGLRFPCVSGAMANGIGSVEVVAAMAKAGMLGFFGAAGLEPAVVGRAIDRLSGVGPFGFNFIHSPAESGLEDALVDLFLAKGVRLVEASAFLDLTPALVRYRLKGGRIVAKVSRVEVATKFLAPPPEKIVRELLASGRVTAEEARLASHRPVAQDLTVEADSGGHTDNRPLVALLPTMLALRDRMQEKHGYAERLRVGAAGGIATPASAAAAFAMGAGWILTGSVNQACVEAGTSEAVREMLAAAEQADTAMAPAADMFEMGVKVQVLKRGTMFAMRAQKLFDLYRSCDSLEAIPAAERSSLEANLFRTSLEEVWRGTREYFLARDPAEVARAEKEPRHRMALVFRWYLGMSSRWANAGEPTRRMDYQVWCGPSMGAFNEWARGSFLEDRLERRVAVVARNLLYGAAVMLRASALRSQGLDLPPAVGRALPRTDAEIDERVRP